MQLSPLQSRLIASLAASFVVFALYLLLCSPYLALAAELVAGDEPSLGLDFEHTNGMQLSYQPEFGLFDRDIVGRAAQDIIPLSNNAPKALNLEPGSKACYVINQGMLSGRDGASNRRDARNRNVDIEGPYGSYLDASLLQRADATTLYISANTCLKPSINGSQAPQLSLFVSNSSDIDCPGPSQDDSKQQKLDFVSGAVMYSINATADVYISVVAPNVTGNTYQGMWNFEIAASTDEYYYRYDTNTSAQLLWMDSDSTSALLLTRNLTENTNDVQRIMNETLPYELFVENANNSATQGLENSICGLQNNAQIFVSKTAQGKINNVMNTALTTRGPGGFPKQQFYFGGLNESSSYTGFLVKTPHDSSDIVNNNAEAGTQGGGGVVYTPTSFQTTAETNCRVVVGLDFCDDVQYSVPGNDRKFNGTALWKVYDDYARTMYENFQKVMMQIPCEAPATSQYSLARNCSDCERAYKRWLCLVAMPRCEDFTSESEYVIVRNVAQPFPNGTMLPESIMGPLQQNPWNNQSRNHWIDNVIQPGPYKELLPCADLCYEVVQSCPAAIGFTCPLPGRVGFNTSYAVRPSNDSTVTCNYPGEALTPLGAARVMMPSMLVLGISLALAVWLVW